MSGGQICIVFTGILAGDGADFRREQGENDPVFVGTPNGSIVAEEGGSGGLFAAESRGAFEQAVHKPFKAYGNFVELALKFVGNAVDHRGANKRFADGGGGRPLIAVGVEIVDRDREVVIGIEEPAGGGNDAVPIEIRIVSNSNVIGFFEFDEPAHSVRRGAVHTGFTVVIAVHEAEGGIGEVVADVDIEAVGFADGVPVCHTGTAHGIGTN